jgi:hypothetical protein
MYTVKKELHKQTIQDYYCLGLDWLFRHPKGGEKVRETRTESMVVNPELSFGQPRIEIEPYI